MIRNNHLKTIGALIVGVVVLSGCRVEEQDRIMRYEPGVYKGKADTELSEDQRRTLRQRSAYQNKGIVSGGQGGVEQAHRSSDVRKPSDPGLDRAKLKARIQHQGGSGL